MTSPNLATATVVHSFCRICTGGCGVELTLGETGHIERIVGDRSNTLSQGYACFKGLQSPGAHRTGKRLLHPLKRLPDGSYQEISLEQALDEIAARLAELIAARGPEAIASFCGNGAILNSTAVPMQKAFLQAIGSTQYFSTMTIDQSAKIISRGRLGGWGAGIPELDDMDVALLVGANPLISHAGTGILNADPIKRLKAARAKGLKLIVIDPRNTETAAVADLVLQPLPGQDAAIMAGLLRIILQQGLEDADFCQDYVGKSNMEALRRAIEPFTADRVEASAGLGAGQLQAVAEMFARDAMTGCAYGATGPDMGPASNLAQHLIDCLNVVCGRFLRAGARLRRVNVLDPPRPIRAEVLAADRSWERHGPSRIRGARLINGERPSGTLSDEILTPGPEQIRALIVDGGDPVTSLPEQQRTLEALASLELLVCIEPWPSPTARLAHYVLPPKMQYERADLSFRTDGRSVWPGAWAQFTPAVLQATSMDVADDWYMFWAIARRLGRSITYAGQKLDMTVAPSTEDLLALQLQQSHVNLEQLRQHAHGLELDLGDALVLPRAKDNAALFDVMPDDVAEECRRYLEEHVGRRHFERDGSRFTHLLSVRRMRDFFNSNGMHIDSVRARNPYNPAYLSAGDMTALELADGDFIELESAHGRIVAIAKTDERLRSQVVSIAHGWGGLPGPDADPATHGSNVNQLTETRRHAEAINAMPHMTAVPVNIRKLAASASERTRTIADD